MCDIWKANQEKRELKIEDLERWVAGFGKLNVKEVVLSGGEPLMHSNLWNFCNALKRYNIKITLLSTGLLLKRYSKEILNHTDEVIISLDGSQPVHDRIRNVSNAFEKLAEGVASLKDVDKKFRVSGRCVIQRWNYHDFFEIVNAARELRLDQISFLPADLSSTAFNHDRPLNDEKLSETALLPEEVNELEKLIKDSFVSIRWAYDQKFIAESPEKMRRIVQYYKAILKIDNFPVPVCNAPWVSAVIESDGSVMPCFFHKPYGNIYDKPLEQIINSKDAIEFRRTLDVRENNTCQKCVCTLKRNLVF